MDSFRVHRPIALPRPARPCGGGGRHHPRGQRGGAGDLRGEPGKRRSDGTDGSARWHGGRHRVRPQWRDGVDRLSHRQGLHPDEGRRAEDDLVGASGFKLAGLHEGRQALLHAGLPRRCTLRSGRHRRAACTPDPEGSRRLQRFRGRAGWHALWSAVVQERHREDRSRHRQGYGRRSRLPDSRRRQFRA